MSKRVILFSGVDGLTQQSVPKPWMPLSVLTIGTYLKYHGYEPLLLDPQIHPEWEERVADACQDGIVYLGVTCMTGPSIYNVLKAIAIARKIDPTIPVVWGGYHATLRFNSIVREGHADAVTRGPGETAALMLAKVFENRRAGDPGLAEDLAAIPNIAFQAPPGERMPVRITRSERMDDIGSLPPCDFSLLDPRLYYTATDRRVPYISSYGCPYACAYCSEPTNSGRRWRGLAPERIVTEVHQLVDAYQPDVIDFMDPNFSSDPRRVVAFVEEVKKRPTSVGYMCNMRARDVVMISQRMPISGLAEAGFTRIFLGVESGSDRVLDHLDKAATASDTYVACQALSAAGIETWTSFMHDLPTESPEESEESLVMAERLMHLDGNFQSHHFYMPFPDTRLFNDEFGHLDLSQLSQADWAESSTKGSALWRGRPEFRNRVIDRLEDLRSARPHVFALTGLPERPASSQEQEVHQP
jgi:anaerobic magnesium-protoporphyrin IX monomethyl ester cyclase